MKIFVIGGVTVKKGAPGFDDEIGRLRTPMEALGAGLALQGHEVVVCSPFGDSADFYILHGISAKSKDAHPTISVYYPQIPAVESALRDILSKTGLSRILRFPCSIQGGLAESEVLHYAWLFAQLNAMESSAGIVVVGGKQSGSLNLLLSIAEARNKAVLPLTFLGGAARDHFNASYWRLKDAIPNDIALLDDPSAVAAIPGLLETLLAGRQLKPDRSFFISYARARQQKADYVENLLRRRNYIVYRDEEEFEPSADTQSEIIRNIKRASVFVALWCREYACSPWCFDELEIGLERHAKGFADLWIFCVDDTRIVPKAARSLNYYLVDSREKLEAKVIFLLAKLEEHETQR